MAEQYRVKILPDDFGRAVRLVIMRGDSVYSSATIDLREFEQFMEAIETAFADFKSRPSGVAPRLAEAFAEEVRDARGENDQTT